MKTPGVYIKEKNTFPNSVVEAPTSIPAFIGITGTAANSGESLLNRPWKISSMTEYIKYFGMASTPRFLLSIGAIDGHKDKDAFFVSAPARDGKTALKATLSTKLYSLYYNLILFFANGGGTCYIVSVGTYADNKPLGKEMVAKALTALQKESEVTLVVVPEAVNSTDCADIQAQMIEHCGVDMRNRFAILDVPQGDSDKSIQNFRNRIDSTGRGFAAAYYPYLCTSVLGDKDITANMFVWDDVQNMSQGEMPDFRALFPEGSKIYDYANDCMAKLKTVQKSGPSLELETLASNLHGALLQNWPEYQALVKRVKEHLNLLPPSAAMAGSYTMVDNTRGVWKAPANVSVNYVVRPSVDIDNHLQEDLNVPMDGKAINVIRSFVGEGIKVWGARTLDGNWLDSRYISVRRTMIFLEESVKNAARAYVFEPNVASTWLNIKSQIETFLRGIWKRGGLAGAVPGDAFEVHVGLGETMTSDDILEDIMRIMVLVAISHPMEFSEIIFQQQMQKS